MMPRVSVLIPVYNRAAYLLDAVKTLCAQTWPDLEVIFADDGSDDDTPDIIEAITEGRALLPEQERRKGTSADLIMRGMLSNTLVFVSSATSRALVDTGEHRSPK